MDPVEWVIFAYDRVLAHGDLAISAPCITVYAPPWPLWGQSKPTSCIQNFKDVLITGMRPNPRNPTRGVSHTTAA